MHIFYPSISRRVTNIWPNWSTTAGGFAVGYVFLLLLPKLTIVGNKGMAKWPEYPMLGLSVIYLFVLLGFVSYWIIDLLSGDDHPNHSYWRRIQSTSFFLYNVLMGELLATDHNSTPFVFSLTVFSILFHLAGMNHLFNHWHPNFFIKRMRWIMSLGLLIGAMGGYFEVFSNKVIGLATAYMGGAILINVIYYEMPRKKGHNTIPFLSGIMGFLVIITLVRYLMQH